VGLLGGVGELSLSPDPYTSSSETTNNWSGGVGADAAFAAIDGGVSVLVNNDSINAAIAYKGYGYGFSTGGDVCYSGKW
jgi:hypothetical protein